MTQHTDPSAKGPAPLSGHVDAHGHHYDPMHNEDVAHEHSDVSVNRILWSAVVLTVVAAVVHIVVYFMMGWLDRAAAANDPQVTPLAIQAPQLPRSTTEAPTFGNAASPQLLTNEYMALEKHRAQEAERLTNYGWVDQKTGAAHLPIAEAKKLMLQRAIATPPGTPQDPAMGTNSQATGESSGGRAIPTGKHAPPAAAQPGHGTDAPGHGTGTPQAPATPPKGHGQ
jgi:hypothetical protein